MLCFKSTWFRFKFSLFTSEQSFLFISGTRHEKLVSINRFLLAFSFAVYSVFYFALFSGFMYFNFSESLVHVLNKLQFQRISKFLLVAAV